MIGIFALALTATAPVPQGAPPFQYPAAAIQNGEEGKVEYEIEVDASGRATGCRVVSSSGHALLDKEACRHAKRVRFKPAQDSDGRPVPGTFRSSWEWKISPQRR